jgi:nitrous oxide reductase accessory protein NosL
MDWEDIPPVPPVEVYDESSIAALAVAGVAIASWPKPDGEWVWDTKEPVFVCGESMAYGAS